MVIGEDKNKLGVMSTYEALAKAKELDLDLVEVAPNENPPVCKIMDYGKFKYQQRKRDHDSKKKQKIIHVKEIKLRPKIEEHDFQFKLKHIKRFLSGGDKAKVTVNFRGRELCHKDIGRRILDRIVKELNETATVEQQPRSMGRTMFMIITPK